MHNTPEIYQQNPWFSDLPDEEFLQPFAVQEQGEWLVGLKLVGIRDGDSLDIIPRNEKLWSRPLVDFGETIERIEWDEAQRHPGSVNLLVHLSDGSLLNLSLIHI